MNDDHHDDEILELTEDMTSDGGDSDSEHDEPRGSAPPPASPFTLLAQPRSETTRRESRPSYSGKDDDDVPPSRPSFVPDAKPGGVLAVPIKNLDGRDQHQPVATPVVNAKPEEPAPEPSVEDDDPAARSEEALEVVAEPETPPEQLAAEEPEPEVEPEMEEPEGTPAEEPEPEPEPESEMGEPEGTPAEEAQGEAADDEEPLELQEDLVVSEESAGGEGEEPGSVEHPFDFGTPEMVFDGTAPSEVAADGEPADAEEPEEDFEELDDEELEEEPEEEPEEPSVEVDVEIPEAGASAVGDEEEGGLKTMGETFLEEAASKQGAKRGARKRRRKSKREWWSSVFDDDFLLVSPQPKKRDLRREVELIQKNLAVPPGSLILDLACGSGRHAVAMARKNYRVVGVDLSLSMLARAGELAQEADQKINFIHGDMRDLGFSKTFDAVYCVGTSLGFFDEATNLKVLEGIYNALKPGAPFMVELVNRDFVVPDQPNMVWFDMDGVVCMEETDFNYINSRLYISRQLIINNGERQAKHEYSVRLYSLHEIGQLLHSAGFAVTKVSGHYATSGAFFGPDSPQLIIVAERRR